MSAGKRNPDLSPEKGGARGDGAPTPAWSPNPESAGERKRKVIGDISSRIYAEVGEKIDDDMELAEMVEKHLTNQGWKAIWLSEGLDYDYALLFLGESRYEGVFLWVSEFSFNLVDLEKIADHPVIATTFAYMVANYFSKR